MILDSDIPSVGNAGTRRWTERPWTRPSSGLHWFMTYTTAGTAYYRVGHVQLTVSTGDLYLVHRDTPFEHRSAGAVAWSRHFVEFEPWQGWLPGAPFVRVSDGLYRAHIGLRQSRQDIEDAFRRLINHVRSRDVAAALGHPRRKHLMGDVAEARKQLAVTALREILQLAGCDAVETTRLDPRIVAALHVVTGDLSADHDIDALATAAGLSPSRFTHLFREQVGVPIGRAIRTLRLQEAALLLAYGGASVATVAEEVGFSTLYYFSRAFRRAYGVSPRAYRERSRTPRLPPRSARGSARRRGTSAKGAT
jgi:AraC family transcriptional regulator of arabinose operon